METIGDAYMVAAGLLDTSKEHAEAITNMAFDMRDEAGKVMKPTSNEPLEVCRSHISVCIVVVLTVHLLLVFVDQPSPAYIHTYIHTHIHTYIHTYIHTSCIHIIIHPYVHARNSEVSESSANSLKCGGLIPRGGLIPEDGVTFRRADTQGWAYT